MALIIGGKPKRQLLRELKEGGFLVADEARDIIINHAFTTLPETELIDDLGIVIVRDLGSFPEREPTTGQLWARIRESGYGLCPAETALHLRLQGDQGHGNYCWMAMERVAGSKGNLYVFTLRRGNDGKLWLDVERANPGDPWRINSCLIVRLQSHDRRPATWGSSDLMSVPV